MNRHFFKRDMARERKWGFSQAMNGFLIVRGVGEAQLTNPLKEAEARAILEQAEEACRASVAASGSREHKPGNTYQQAAKEQQHQKES